MADSLILKGVKDVRKHKGTDMLFRYPKGRGDAQHSLKKWWVNGEISTQYVKASVFDVLINGEIAKLALTATPSSTVRIDLADDGTFEFFGANGVDYGALFTAEFELIEYYVMPRLAGGKVMTVTPADGADRPTAPEPPAPSPAPAPDGGARISRSSSTAGPKPSKASKVKVDCD